MITELKKLFEQNGGLVRTAELKEGLVEKLGIVDAERFAAMIKRESFDYTIWRREYFDKMDLEQISAEAATYAQSHPHKGKGVRV